MKIHFLLFTLIATVVGLGCNDVPADGHLIVPDGTTTIENSAFANCNALKSIKLPNSVTTIEVSAFSQCRELVNVTLGNGITDIKKTAFYYCSALKTIEFPNSVTYFGQFAFSYCDALQSIKIPDSVKTIDYYAFANSGLTSVEFPYRQRRNRLTIRSNAFIGNSLTSVTVPDATDIRNNAFDSDVTVTIVKQKCSEVQDDGSLIIIDGVTTIESSAFENCSALKTIEFPNSVTSIGHSAFAYSGLTSVTIGNGVTTIEHSVFAYSNLTSVEILDSVKTIGEEAFYRCSLLTSVTIGIGVTSIEEHAFANSGLTSVKLPYGTDVADNAFDSGITINRRLPKCSDVPTDGHLIIPDGTTTIGQYAFSYCSALKTIEFPNSVTSIGYGAFQSSNLGPSIVIPDNVTSIGDSAFDSCSKLVNVILGKGITKINYAVFANSWRLANINIPDSITSIGGEAFMECSSLKTIVIPDSVKTIDYYAFSMTSLTSVQVARCTDIADDAFDSDVTIIRGCSTQADVNAANAAGYAAGYAACYAAGQAAGDVCPTSLDKCNATGLQNIKTLYNNHPDKPC